MKRIIAVASVFVIFLSSCGEKKKSDLDDYHFVDIMGASRDTVIGNSGFRIALPSLYKIDKTSGNDYVQYLIHPKDAANNKSFIKIFFGNNPDTTAPSFQFKKSQGEGTDYNKKMHWVTYDSESNELCRKFFDDWNGQQLMIEEMTTNQVEAYNMIAVMKSLQPDSTSNH